MDSQDKKGPVAQRAKRGFQVSWVQMDGLVLQGIKEVLVSQGMEEDQGYLDLLESKVFLVQGVILVMMEIWEIQGLLEIQVSQVHQVFKGQKVNLDSLTVNLVHQVLKDCQERMDAALLEGVQEILVTQDPQGGQDSLDHQATQGIKEDQEDQVTLGHVAHKGAQVFQVLQEIMEVSDHQAHPAHMGLKDPLDHQVSMD